VIDLYFVVVTTVNSSATVWITYKLSVFRKQIIESC